MGTKYGQKRKTARRAYRLKEAAPAGFLYWRAFKGGWYPSFNLRRFTIRWKRWK